MKNLYLLPTNKISKLVYNTDNDLTLTSIKIVQEFSNKKVNIYITSDEEIKEGDFGYTSQIEGNIVKIDEQTLAHKEQLELKKVILTTDQDLIEDGVQEIDDEFLEWFIKNTNYEQISIEEVYFHGSGYYKASELSEQEREKYSFMKEYKIIIPKEERMYSEEEVLSFGKSCFYKGFEKSEKDDANCYTAFKEEIGKLFKQFKMKK